jgi:hypothetical protein
MVATVIPSARKSPSSTGSMMCFTARLCAGIPQRTRARCTVDVEQPRRPAIAAVDSPSARSSARSLPVDVVGHPAVLGEPEAVQGVVHGRFRPTQPVGHLGRAHTGLTPGSQLLAVDPDPDVVTAAASGDAVEVKEPVDGLG